MLHKYVTIIFFLSYLPSHVLICEYILLTVTFGCGGTSSENCTYFESSGTPSAGECRAKVCPCNDNICQVINMALDLPIVLKMAKIFIIP